MNREVITQVYRFNSMHYSQRESLLLNELGKSQFTSVPNPQSLNNKLTAKNNLMYDFQTLCLVYCTDMYNIKYVLNL